MDAKEEEKLCAATTCSNNNSCNERDVVAETEEVGLNHLLECEGEMHVENVHKVECDGVVETSQAETRQFLLLNSHNGRAIGDYHNQSVSKNRSSSGTDATKSYDRIKWDFVDFEEANRMKLKAWKGKK
ncbi:hypothetical protein VNO78_18238 [Psophocarpus tetragonolobus]|uniref:Uncharacterized protein n=1 Tax=Psophocarpus tetragonolobus TaxID=3891 RepID=A0AAN9SJG3_PSOTE